MKKVMIVDDSLMIRINLRRMLEKQDYQVVAEATNGQEAIEKYMKFKPDLVTMDITMPVLDGISALKEICTLDQNALVVMISAMGQERKIIEAINKGARHYIIKPFKEEDVIRIIGDVLQAGMEEKANACASR